MAKITISRIFEVSLIATSKAYTELQPFIEYVNGLADNVIRILRNGITLGDNIKCSLISQKFTPGQTLTFAVNARPVGVIVIASERPVSSFQWDYTTNDTTITATVTSTSAVAFTVKMCVFYS